jgi:hypothetical protein
LSIRASVLFNKRDRFPKIKCTHSRSVSGRTSSNNTNIKFFHYTKAVGFPKDTILPRFITEEEDFGIHKNKKGECSLLNFALLTLQLP